jgi:hypothetical protein
MRFVRCALAACLLAGLASGCAALHFDRVRLGMTPAEYDRLLPTAQSKRLDGAICFFQDDGLGRADAIVALLGQDRRIEARIVTTRQADATGLPGGFRVIAEYEPRLANAAAVSPFDAARMLRQRVAEIAGDPLALSARRQALTGLERFLERWPHLSPDEALGEIEQAERRAVDPGGGEARVRALPGGTMRLEYERGNPPR